MEKQTAVEWLFLMLNNPNNDQVFTKKLLDKAKAMEKEQQGYSEEEAYSIWQAGQNYGVTSGSSITFEELTKLLRNKKK